MQDISGQLNSGSTVANMCSANWKERKAALDEVEGMLTAAANRIQPQVPSTSSGEHAIQGTSTDV